MVEELKYAEIQVFGVEDEPVALDDTSEDKDEDEEDDEEDEDDDDEEDEEDDSWQN